MPLSAGDFVFVGRRSSLPNSFAILTTVDLSAADRHRIMFAHSAPFQSPGDGTLPNADQGLFWSVTEDIAAGEIVRFSNVSTGAPVASRGIAAPGAAPIVFSRETSAVRAYALPQPSGAHRGDVVDRITPRPITSVIVGASASETAAADCPTPDFPTNRAARVAIARDAEAVAFARQARFRSKSAALAAVCDPANWRVRAWPSAPMPTSPPFMRQLAVCFVKGSQIRTPLGAVRIEDLRAGDAVATLAGVARQVLWIGERHYDPLMARAFGDAVAPIRIMAGALGPGAPSRDLYVSRNHAIYIEGVLIPVRNLLNGRSIRRDNEVASVSYFHVKLASHDVIFANDAPVESYLPSGCVRGEPSVRLFDNADTYPHRHAASLMPETRRFLRLVDPDDPKVARIRERLSKLPAPA